MELFRVAKRPHLLTFPPESSSQCGVNIGTVTAYEIKRVCSISHDCLGVKAAMRISNIVS